MAICKVRYPMIGRHRWKFVGMLAAMCSVASGCRRGATDSFSVLEPWLSDLTNYVSLARLDRPSCRLVSSYDRSGGNQDYNHFAGPSRDRGWVVMADLEGPGVMRRFWFTGGDPTHRVRLYFDGERRPRLDLSVSELCGGQPPFLPPLAAYENYAYYCWVPFPYARRLRVECEAGGWKPDGKPLVFYQIEYTPLPAHSLIRSFPHSLGNADRDLLEHVRRVWAGDLPNQEIGMQSRTFEGTLRPASAVEVFSLQGPAIVRELKIALEQSAIPSASDREKLLRDLVLRIHWNNQPSPSVEVPLGDFFGSVWRPIPFQSLFFGMTGMVFESRFPMPFQEQAHVRLANDGPHPVGIRCIAVWAPLSQWDTGWGYFHSGWFRTGPQEVGHPHPIVRAHGRGRLAGCLLAVTSLAPSFWILEGDEIIRRDEESSPSWRGTGLEDYFNGGWYYQNVLTRPLHGLPFKTFFRTVQYRLHLADPVGFTSALEMEFERGPDHASQGWMESVSYYYLEQPAPASGHLPSAPDRQAVADPMAPRTIMTELWNHERFGDLAGAQAAIDAFLERFPDFEYAPVLRLRQVAYDEARFGFEAVRAAYENVARAQPQTMAGAYARLLLWYHADPRHALLGVYANTATRVFLDGTEMGTAGDPHQMKVWPRILPPGRHVIALQAAHRPYPDWVQACLRTHRGDVVTAPGWKHAFDPPGRWADLDYDDRDWAPVTGTGVKGPPEEPYLWVVPDPFVQMQSKAVGLRPSRDWPHPPRTVVFRKVFELR